MKLSESNIRKITFILFCSICLVVFTYAVLFPVQWLSDRVYMNPGNEPVQLTSSSPDDISQLTRRAATLKRNLEKISSDGNPFLIINTSDNTFRLYNNFHLVGSGLCSTGSRIHLEVDSTRSWIFETPRGVLQVRNKIVDPVWRKPDWAFIEDGLQPPPPGHPSRFERGVLGDYALDLGNGYLIHGTLYQRLLGMPVTHGCIRMNDSDLELVYRTLQIGSKVYIY